MLRCALPPQRAIQSSDVAVVVQGPLLDCDVSRACLKSLRRSLPGAQVILSTWSDDRCRNAAMTLSRETGVDEVVFSRDPGGEVHDPQSSTRSSIHRILHSVQSGLELVDREYTLRIRDDCEVQYPNFLRHWERVFPWRDPTLQVFEGKVLVPGIFTRSHFPRPSHLGLAASFPAILHVSDWIAFGLTPDIATLYGGDPPREPEYSRYMDRLWDGLPDNAPFKGRANFQFPPEMVIGQAVGARVGISMDHYLDSPQEWSRLAEAALLSNFIVLSLSDFAAINHKYSRQCRFPWLYRSIFDGCMTTLDYSNLHRRVAGASGWRLRPRTADLLVLFARQVNAFESRLPLRPLHRMRAAAVRKF